MFRIYGDPNDPKKYKTNFPAATNEHRIKIIFKDESAIRSALQPTTGDYGTIIGYLSKEFEYSSKGNYTNVFNTTGSDSLLLKVAEDATQRTLIPVDYGFLTKKMFTHGESPTISVEFRCWAGESSYTGSEIKKIDNKNQRVATDEKNNPVVIANALINATLPRITSKAALLNSNVTDAGGKAIRAVADAGVDLTKFVVNGLPITQFYKAATGGSGGEDLKNAGTNVLNDLSSWFSKKPPVCHVIIGNIFSKDMMVVLSVDVKFSKEYVSEGVPLYADFNVTFQSLFSGSSIEDGEIGSQTMKERMFGSGFNHNKNTRVTFNDAEITTQDFKNMLKNAKQGVIEGATDFSNRNVG